MEVLKILAFNSGRRRAAMAQLRAFPDRWDILCLQEPYVIAGKVTGLPSGATVYQSSDPVPRTAVAVLRRGLSSMVLRAERDFVAIQLVWGGHSHPAGDLLQA